MSELQAALLAIGLVVVVAVYLFGWWKQRQYSRKFGAAFRQSHDDVLYQAVQPEKSADILDGSVMVNVDALPDDALAGRDELPLQEPDTAQDVSHPGPEAQAPAAVQTVQITPAAVATFNEPSLSARSDFIIEMQLAEPVLATVLDGLWQRKFDFRKPVQVFGLSVRSGQWERVIAESTTLYSEFRIGLQLVDRSGVISVTKLSDFRDLVLGIAKLIYAGTAVPDIQQTHLNAQSLDALCAEVDQMVGVNLLPPGNRQLNGGKISEAAALQGMKLESDGAFHLPGTQGQSLITLINQDSKPFQHHTLEHFSTAGVTLMLDVPRVAHPAENFDLLVRVAHALARELQVNLVDDNRVPLTEAGLERIRQQISDVEAKMCENALVPGSTQALRLFS